jgi:uncharacterized protein HemX
MRISAEWLDRYFDVRNPAVAAARAELLALQKSPVGVDLPGLNASQNALRSLLAVSERRAEPIPATTPAKAARSARKN